MASKTDTLELYRKHLFDNPDKPLPPHLNERLIRIRASYIHWCEFPMKSEVEIRDFIISLGVEKSMAYYDLEIIKILLGNIKNAGKEWHRYRLIAMAEETYSMAKDQQDAKGMAMAMDKYGKYTQLHIPDHEQIPYDQIINQPFEPTSDPTSLGLVPEPDIDKKISLMKEKYSGEIDANIQDVEFVELIEHANAETE